MPASADYGCPDSNSRIKKDGLMLHLGAHLYVTHSVYPPHFIAKERNQLYQIVRLQETAEGLKWANIRADMQ
jgi:hypothetical protein